jgi:hypothetical protein
MWLKNDKVMTKKCQKTTSSILRQGFRTIGVLNVENISLITCGVLRSPLHAFDQREKRETNDILPDAGY